jgi:hypothetical protein
VGGDGQRRRRDRSDAILRIVEPTRFAGAELTREAAEQLEGARIVEACRPATLGVQFREAEVADQTRQSVQRVVVPTRSFARRERGFVLLDGSGASRGLALRGQGLPEQELRVRALRRAGRDAERVLEDRDVDPIAAVVAVLEPLVRPARLGHAPHQIEVALPRRFEVGRASPDVERRRVVRSCGTPVPVLLSVPIEVTDRLRDLGVRQVAVLRALRFTLLRGQSFDRLIDLRRVRILARCRRAPRAVLAAEAHPARLRFRKRLQVDGEVEVAGIGECAAREGGFGLGTQLLIGFGWRGRRERECAEQRRSQEPGDAGRGGHDGSPRARATQECRRRG